MARTNQNQKPTDQNETPKAEVQEENKAENGTTEANAQKTEGAENNATENKDAANENAENTGDQKPTDQNETPKAEVQENGEGSAASENNGIEKMYTVENPLKKNKKLYGTTGKIIEFDENGAAVCGHADAEHFSRIDGYTVKEK